MNRILLRISLLLALLVSTAASAMAQSGPPTGPAPTITSFTQPRGVAGALVVINGTNLADVSSVQIGGMPADNVRVVSATMITAQVSDPGMFGYLYNSPIQVTTPGGTATSSAAFYVQPTIMSVQGSPVGLTGSTISFTGINLAAFGPTGNVLLAPTVTIGGKPATGVQVVSGPTGQQLVRANVGAGAETGKITLTTPGGTAVSSGDITIIKTPTITSFSPTSGKVGDTVTITGTNFLSSLPPSVQIGGANATNVNVVSSTRITARVGVTAQDGKITVQNASLVSTPSAGTFTVNGPQVVSFTPVKGVLPTSIVSGTLVTITGKNLLGTTEVRIGTTPMITVTNTATQITARVAANTMSGPITVVRRINSDEGVSRGIFFVPPVITDFTPTGASGSPVGAGTTVTINGTSLSAATPTTPFALPTVTIGGRPTTIQFVNPNGSRIIARVGVGTGALTNKVVVTTPGGTVTSSGNITVTAMPSITNFTSVKNTGGITVTINGTNLINATAVTIGGVAATIAGTPTNTQVQAVVGTNAVTGRITVTTPGGIAVSAATPAGTYTVDRPTITSFTPLSGPVGTVVTITGKNLKDVTGVRIGGALATSMTVNPAGTSITATVGVGATSGYVVVIAPVWGDTESPVRFVVSTAS